MLAIKMHAADREALERMCNGSIPAEVEKLYFKYKTAFDRVANGPLPPQSLLTIAVDGGGVEEKEAEPHPFDDIPIGASVSVRDDFTSRESFRGQFLGIADGLHRGQVMVTFYSDAENVHYINPARVTVIDDYTLDNADSKHRTVPIVSDEEADATPGDIAASAQSGGPFEIEPGTRVSVSPPGKATAAGWFVGYSDDGRVIVRLRKGGEGKKEKLFDAGDVVPERDEDGSIAVEFDKVADVVTMKPTPGGA